MVSPAWKRFEPTSFDKSTSAPVKEVVQQEIPLIFPIINLTVYQRSDLLIARTNPEFPFRLKYFPRVAWNIRFA